MLGPCANTKQTERKVSKILQQGLGDDWGGGVVEGLLHNHEDLSSDSQPGAAQICNASSGR